MRNYREERELAYTSEQMFDLVADVERYPEFLPGWLMVRVERREGDTLHVEQRVGLGALNLSFSSRANLLRPQNLDIVGTNGAFRTLVIQWRFTPIPGGCFTRFRVGFEMRSALLEKIASKLFNLMARSVVGNFERRARQLYGPASSNKRN